MILRLTTELGRKIGVTPQQRLPADPNPFADWSVRVFRVDRHPYVIVTNTASLYSMLMPGEGIKGEAAFLSRLKGTMERFLKEDGLAAVFEEFVAPSASRILYSKALDRGVTGSMNDCVKSAEWGLLEMGMSLDDISRQLNGTPSTYIRLDSTHEFPQRNFRRLYNQLSGAGIGQSPTEEER